MRDCAPPETATDIATCRIAVGESRLTDQPDVPAAALAALMAGPSDVERANGESSNIRTVTQLSGMTLEDGVATVSFNRYFETAKTRPQVAQVVYTLTQFPEVRAVQFLVDGTTNGATGVGPMTRDDFPELTPAVLLEAPTLAATVGSAFKVTGSAVSPSSGVLEYRVDDAAAAPLAAGKVKVLASPGTRGRFLEPVRLPAGTTGPVTLVLGPPGAELRAPLVVV